MVGARYIPTVPKMRIARYLELAAPIKKLKRFRLCNQEVANGLVYFGDAAGIKRLNEILRFHNTGEMPVEYIKDKEGNVMRSDSTVTKDTKNIFEYQDCLESVKGPDGAGWLTARCPACEFKGAQVGEEGASEHVTPGIRAVCPVSPLSRAPHHLPNHRRALCPVRLGVITGIRHQLGKPNGDAGTGNMHF